ncbi:MAG: hypothetical protein WCL50_02945, partial [Spirochaetota bacterium]
MNASPHRSPTIYSRLQLAIVLVVLLPALVISAASAWSGYRIGRQRSLDQLASVVTLKASEIDMWTYNLTYALDALLPKRELAENALPLLLGQLPQSRAREIRGRLRSDLAEMIESTRVFSKVCLMDARGRVLVSTDSALEDQDFSDSNFYEQGLQRNFITPPFRDAHEDNRLIIAASHPIIAPGEGAAGVLAGYSDIAVL